MCSAATLQGGTVLLRRPCVELAADAQKVPHRQVAPVTPAKPLVVPSLLRWASVGPLWFAILASLKLSDEGQTQSDLHCLLFPNVRHKVHVTAKFISRFLIYELLKEQNASS